MSRKFIHRLIVGGVLIVLFVVFLCTNSTFFLNDSGRKKESDGHNDIDKMIKKVHKMNYEEYEWDKHQNDTNSDRDEATIEYFEVEGKIYFCTFSYVDSKFIENNITVDGVEEEIYKISNIKQEYGLALKTKNGNAFYYYCAVDYNPEDIGQFLEDSGFLETTDNVRCFLYAENGSNEVVVFKDEIEDVFREKFVQLSKIECKTQSRGKGLTGLYMTYNIEPLNEVVSIEFYENGDIYVTTDESAGAYHFYTGEAGREFAVQLLEYMYQNCRGYSYTY